MIERITDKHIKTQALQHLLIHYENKRDRDNQNMIGETINKAKRLK